MPNTYLVDEGEGREGRLPEPMAQLQLHLQPSTSKTKAGIYSEFGFLKGGLPGSPEVLPLLSTGFSKSSVPGVSLKINIYVYMYVYV